MEIGRHLPRVAAALPRSRKVEEPIRDVFAPVAEQLYPVEVGGKRFCVTFTPVLAQALAQAGALIDPATAEMALPRGGRVDLTGVREQYHQDTGKPAPPWTFYDPSRNLYGVPRGVLTLDLDPQTGALQTTTSEGTHYEFSYLRDEVGGGDGFPASAYEKLGDDPNPFVLEIPGGSIKAPDEVTARRVRALFDEVCGKQAASWPERRAERDRVERELQRVEGDPAAVKALLEPETEHEWDAETAAAAVEAYRHNRLAFELPLTIEVVPAGKHFSAMPGMGEPPPGLRDATGARAVTASAQRLFVPVEDLWSERQKCVRHELYHVLEDKYMDTRVRLEVDGVHARTVAANGPFARPYGYQRIEFWTTMAEEFEGCNGPDGPAWLREKHPELYEIFARVTGRG
jgi:hypothetical protein